MQLMVNGESREVADGTTVRELLEQLGVPRGRVAVEVNLQIVRKEDHESHALQSGDRLEIVTFVGGG